MINEPFICNSFMVYHIIFTFPSSDAFRKASENSVPFEDTGIVPPPIFYLNQKAECFVPTFDDPAKGFTTGKICSSINSIAGFDSPTETSKDHLAAKDTDTNDDPYSIIDNLKIKNHNRVIIAHININSLRNKFDILSDIVKNKIDILCISETKLDDTFPSFNFFISGYSAPYRLDRSGNGSGILLCVREDYYFSYYLSDRYQRVRVNSNYSSWSEIICGVPQGSILGPLLFNIYLSELFFPGFRYC